MDILAPHAVKQAYERIEPYIYKTPILTSTKLNELLGHELYFKYEGTQITGAFKIRGALNFLLKCKAQGNLPKKVVAYSSGNHAQGVAYACSLLGVEATIVMASYASSVKKAATIGYGANIIELPNRPAAEAKAQELVAQGHQMISPFDDDDVIAGQGTSCYEALQELGDKSIKPDAIFATCGGGGWLSGTYLATQDLSPQSKVIGCEPLLANDAAISLRQGKIHKMDKSPDTIADGARTLAVSERTFAYLKKLDDFIEVSEEDIIHWTQKLAHYLKVQVEPTSACAAAGAANWLATQTKPQKILVMLSGGNIGVESMKRLYG